MIQQNGIVIAGSRQDNLAFTGAATAVEKFVREPGLYDVWCDEGDVFIRVRNNRVPLTDQGFALADLTASTGYKIRVGTTVPVRVDAGDFIGVFGATTGTLRWHKVDD